ncbi:hypothetical protein EWM64_g7736 [Hericium alpestre]|uniref:Uncharacterized protein n=1 Tax=Hericium alpestre TaxID=135208 RepID=A0A4Y9ZQE3_9AGAM|nr:hypothetical protein EWM64_g7736 [Hericium alpestre]
MLKARLAEYYGLDLSAVPLPMPPAGLPMVTEHIRERQWDHLCALGWEWHETASAGQMFSLCMELFEPPTEDEVAHLLNEVGCLASMHPKAAAVALPAGIVSALSETICAWTGAAALAHSDAVAIAIPQQPLTALSRTLAPLTSTSQANAVKMGCLPAQQAVSLLVHGHSKFEETRTTAAAATLTHEADVLKACEEEILSLESTEDLRDIVYDMGMGNPGRLRASIATEDEEDERHMREGVDEVEELDSDGNTVRSYNVKERHSRRSGTASDKARTSDNIIDDPEDDPEDDEAELKCMSQRWTLPIYAFFDLKPAIEYIDSRKCHSFKCSAKGCRQKIRRYLDTGDTQSTRNMHKHIKKCWGEDVVHAISQAADATVAREKVVKNYLKNGSIMATFEHKNKGQVSYSHRQHTKTETKAEISLMKTGRPGYYVPSPRTVSRDVKLVFAHARTWIAKMLRSHSGINMAKVFAEILEDFGISEKVSNLNIMSKPCSPESQILSVTCQLW